MIKKFTDNQIKVCINKELEIYEEYNIEYYTNLHNELIELIQLFSYKENNIKKLNNLINKKDSIDNYYLNIIEEKKNNLNNIINRYKFNLI